MEIDDSESNRSENVLFTKDSQRHNESKNATDCIKLQRAIRKHLEVAGRYFQSIPETKRFIRRKLLRILRQNERCQNRRK